MILLWASQQSTWDYLAMETEKGGEKCVKCWTEEKFNWKNIADVVSNFPTLKGGGSFCLLIRLIETKHQSGLKSHNRQRAIHRAALPKARTLRELSAVTAIDWRFLLSRWAENVFCVGRKDLLTERRFNHCVEIFCRWDLLRIQRTPKHFHSKLLISHLSSLASLPIQLQTVSRFNLSWQPIAINWASFVELRMMLKYSYSHPNLCLSISQSTLKISARNKKGFDDANYLLFNFQPSLCSSLRYFFPFNGQSPKPDQISNHDLVVNRSGKCLASASSSLPADSFSASSLASGNLFCATTLKRSMGRKANDEENHECFFRQLHSPLSFSYYFSNDFLSSHSRLPPSAVLSSWQQQHFTSLIKCFTQDECDAIPSYN